MLSKIFKILVNKYTITLAAFAAWMIFFDSNSVINRMKQKEKMNSLKQEKTFYLDEIRHDSVLSQKLQSDSNEIEKFAREHYLMKKEKEDVYLVVDTSTADQHQ